jgi:hypothetical protein
MPTNSLPARANTGTGTDQIAGVNTAAGFVGAGMLTDKLGNDIDAANPFPVGIVALKAEDSPHTSGDLGLPLLAMRNDGDAPTAADGDYTLLKMDEEGRLKVSSKPASYAQVSGPIAAVNGQVAIDCSRVSNIVLQMVVPTAVAGHNCSFEASLNSSNGTDGNWIAIQAIRSNANTIETATGVLAATPVYGWECSVNGYKWFRVRATAHTSGSATWVVQPAPFATEPIPAAQVSGTQPISGTLGLLAAVTRIGFMVAHGIWWDDSSTNLAANATFTGTARDLLVTATATAWANAATFAKEFRISAESDVAGTLWVEVSRDNVNWRRIKSVATAAVSGGGHYAEIIHQPSWRYARGGFTNGAGAQTRFSIGSIAIGA